VSSKIHRIRYNQKILAGWRNVSFNPCFRDSYTGSPFTTGELCLKKPSDTVGECKSIEMGASIMAPATPFCFCAMQKRLAQFIAVCSKKASQHTTAFVSHPVCVTQCSPVNTGRGHRQRYLEHKFLYYKHFTLLHSPLEAVHCLLWRPFTVYAASHRL
jgi:hypothetical protein